MIYIDIYNPFGKKLKSESSDSRTVNEIRREFDLGRGIVVMAGRKAVLQKEWDLDLPDGIDVAIFHVVADAGISAGIAIVVSIITAVGSYAYGRAQYKKAQKLAAQRDRYSADAERAEASPTYNRRFQQNVARIGETVPVTYGNIRVFPDLCANQYFTFEDGPSGKADNEFVHLLFCLGHGEFDIPMHRYPVEIAGTPTTINAQVFNIGGRISTDLNLYVAPDGDFDIARWEAGEINSHAITGTTPFDVRVLPARDFSSVEFKPENETAATRFVTYSGQNVPDNWLGPYVVDGRGGVLHGFYMDYHAPRGLYYVDSGTNRAQPSPFYVQYRLLDADGMAVGSWVDLGPTGEPSGKLSSASVPDGNGTPGAFPGNGGVAGFLMRANSSDPTLTRGDSVYYTLPANTLKCEVRVREGRTNNPNLVAGRPYWYGLRGRLLNRPAYTEGLTYIGLKLRATEENVGTRDRISFDVERKLPNYRTFQTDWGGFFGGLNNVMVGTTFTLPSGRSFERVSVSLGAKVTNTGTLREYEITESEETISLPAGTYRVDALGYEFKRDDTLTGTRELGRAIYDLITNDKYGFGIPSAEIDLEGLLEEAEFWRMNEDYFDAVFDREIQAWEALQLMCKVGRGAPILQGGLLTVVRDKPKSNPIMLFDSNNITPPDSFQIQYLGPADIRNDGVKGNFFNRETWVQDEYVATLDAKGVSAVRDPQEEDLLGITDAGKAKEFVDYLERVRTYNRKKVSFKTEMAGLLVQYGDLIAVASDIMTPQYSGLILGIDSSGFRLDREVPSSITSPRGYLRLRDGSVIGAVGFTLDANDRSLVTGIVGYNRMGNRFQEAGGSEEFGIDGDINKGLIQVILGDVELYVVSALQYENEYSCTIEGIRYNSLVPVK